MRAKNNLSNWSLRSLIYGFTISQISFAVGELRLFSVFSMPMNPLLRVFWSGAVLICASTLYYLNPGPRRVFVSEIKGLALPMGNLEVVKAAVLRDTAALPRNAPPECSRFLTDFSETFTSQYGQDAILYYNFFAGWLAEGRRGTYVEVGANAPRILSNTWFMDKCLGWKGICIEADPDLAKTLRSSERTCTVVNMCASSQRSKLPYVSGGVAGTGGHVATPGETPTSHVDCAPLSEILQMQGLEHVDFLSIDVEGNEVSALSGSDWDASFIGLMLIESAWSNEQLDMLLHDAGYWRISDIGYLDDVYIRAKPLLKFGSEGKSRKENWDYIVASDARVSRSTKRTPPQMQLDRNGKVIYQKAV
jgi:FkbM family methyltransferase